MGLDAQKATVATFAERTGAKVLREFVEVESGKKSDRERPELAAALAYARRAGAILVVAKLDRLSRNVRFLSTLMDSNVEFQACDLPEANKLTLHIMACIAEWEAGAISQRTKEGLKQAKARGVLLGSNRIDHWVGREEARREGGRRGRAKAAVVISSKARTEYQDLFPIVRQMRADGLSYAAIAKALNDQGHSTRTGKPFSAPGARRVWLYSGGD